MDENQLTKVMNYRGIGGATTDDFLEYIDDVLLDVAPSKVFFNIGTNDIKERSAGGYECVYDALQKYM